MKRFFVFTLAAFCSIIAKALPYDIEVDGICYKINADEAIVTVFSDDEEKNSRHYSGSIVIPENITFKGKKYPVTTIGPKAFMLCLGVTEVTLPNTLTTISSEAFKEDGVGLRKIHFGANVKDIAKNAFHSNRLESIDIDPENKNLILEDGILYTADHKRAITFVCEGWNYDKEVRFHEALETIDDGFAGGRRFYSIKFNDALKSIGEYAFKYAFSGSNCIKTLTLPDGIEHIGQYAFEDCIRINDLHLPDSLTRLETHSFSYVGPRKIHMPKNLKVICDNALSCASGGAFSNLVLPEGLDSIGEYGITCIGCEKLIVPASVRYLSSHSLDNTSTYIEIKAPLEVIPKSAMPSQSAKEIILPKTVKRLESAAFYPCYRLEKITWPDALEYIGPLALAGNKINPMVVPSTVKQLGGEALSDNVWEPRTYYFTSKTPPVCEKTSVFNGITYEYSTLYVPKGCKEAYSMEAPWYWFGTIEEYSDDDPIVGICQPVMYPAAVTAYDMSGKPVDNNYQGVVVKNGKKAVHL